MTNPKIHNINESMEEGGLPATEEKTVSESQERKTTTSKDIISTSTESHHALDKEDEDLVAAKSLSEIMVSVSQKYITSELNIINNAETKFGKLKLDNPLQNIESLDPLVKMKTFLIPGDSHVVGWAETEVDATIEDIAAWQFTATSNVRMNEFKENGGREKMITKHNDHSQIDRKVFDFTNWNSLNRPRELLGQNVWKWENDAHSKMNIASSPIIDEELAPSSGKRFIRATMYTLLKLERLEPVAGFPRTKVTYFAQEDLVRGYISKMFLNRKIIKLLNHLSFMRLAFDQSLKIDQTSRDAMVLEMQLTQRYSVDETKQIDEGLETRSAFSGSCMISPALTFIWEFDIL